MYPVSFEKQAGKNGNSGGYNFPYVVSMYTLPRAVLFEVRQYEWAVWL